MTVPACTFAVQFQALTGFQPFPWQTRLFERFTRGDVPSALDLPTGLGKTSVMAIWLIALARGAMLPRRLVYVVDRRAVVDQATSEAERLRTNAKAALGVEDLPISTLRGQFVDNREWLADPAAPAIIVGTVDMVGSRLLFCGYGVSPKMRPYHAGLLGADSLIVLDEAHLVPPFQRLLQSVADGAETFAATEDRYRALVPPFRLLPLSATGLSSEQKPFCLAPADRSDPGVAKRLGAPKKLTIGGAPAGRLAQRLADEAWALTARGAAPIRCLVYCDRRQDAEKVKQRLDEFAHNKGGLPKADTQLFVGARRVREREEAKEWLEGHGFLAGSVLSLERPAILVATSAGEVGVDLDADHMVGDLVPWERMVQRLGRVNRRGERSDSQVSILVAENDKNAPDALASEAWSLTQDGKRAVRCLIYLSEKSTPKDKEENTKDTKKIKETLDGFAKPKKKGEPQKGDIKVLDDELVGGDWLQTHGFLSVHHTGDRPALLIADGTHGLAPVTDYLVCDLVAWPRMVKRLDSVRRGTGTPDSDFLVIAGNDLDKRLWKTQQLLTRLPPLNNGWNASPEALLGVREQSGPEPIVAASTIEPLRPALTRALVDAWSTTSLEHHTGRPEVEPWLRGWVDELPQTAVGWRTFLPVQVDVVDWPRTPAEKEQIEDFFEAVPPHESERLQTESFRVANWLQQRAQALLSPGPAPANSREDQGVGPDPSVIDDKETAEKEAPSMPSESLKRDDIVAVLLSSGSAYTGRYTLAELAGEKSRFEGELAGKLLVVDARLSGLKDGLLDPSSEALPDTADTAGAWTKQVGFRVRRETVHRQPEDDWRFEDEFVLRRDDEGTPLEWLTVEHFREAALKEDARSIAKPQELADHQEWTRRVAMRLAASVRLSDPTAMALALAAALHDEGKKAPRWQRAFNAVRDTRLCGLKGPLAKTRGPIDQALLDGYRHEFGSLPYVEKNPEFLGLPDDFRDLVLHLVAAHHGFARPVIEIRGCEDAPPSALERRARDVALRFARLQQCWGPWGLAWLEALLRAADAQASRDNDKGRGPPKPEEG